MFNPNEVPAAPLKPRQAKRPKATALSLQVGKIKQSISRLYTARKDAYVEIQTAIWDGTVDPDGKPEYTGEELVAALAAAGVISPEELQWLACVEKAVLNHLVPGTITDTVPEAKITL
jgi:hypothetical protein